MYTSEQDILDLIREIDAYRELDGKDFDFGTGLIKNEMSFGSEDVYYEMELQNLIEEYLEYDLPVEKKKKKKYKPNKRYFMEREKQHLKMLYKISPGAVWDRETWLKRSYRGSRSACLKKVSNKKIRNYKGEFSKKGKAYKKVYDYWYIMY